MSTSCLVTQESESNRVHRAIGESILEASGGGAVLVCRPLEGTSQAILSDVAVQASTPEAGEMLQQTVVGTVFPQDCFRGASPAMTKGFVEVPLKDCVSPSRVLGQRRGLELQWLICDEETRAILAWIVFTATDRPGPSRRGIRLGLSNARNQVKKALKRSQVHAPAERHLRGFVMFDVDAGVVDASPGLAGWASRKVVAARIAALARQTTSGFEASIAGATLRCERLAQRSNLQIGWVRENRPIELAPKSLLTPAQQRVAEYAVEGATCAEISRTLEASVETIRSHMKEIYRRLGVCCRAELTQLLVGN